MKIKPENGTAILAVVSIVQALRHYRLNRNHYELTQKFIELQTAWAKAEGLGAYYAQKLNENGISPSEFDKVVMGLYLDAN